MRTALIRGAVAGATAAGVWAAAEAPLSRVAGTGFTDVALLGRCTGLSGRRATAAGLALHLANGAAFGATFGAAGGRGVRAGFVAAQVEGTVLWPLMRVLDPEHFTKRVFAQEVITHALFGAVLGLGLPRGTARESV
jgi:hypothetical protein